MLTKRSRWEVKSQGHRGRKNPQFWSGIEEVPYCLSRSSLQLQRHMDKTIANLTPTLSFPDDNSSWIYRWLGNDAQTLDGAYRRSPIFFRGHLSNFKVIGAKKIANMTSLVAFKVTRPVAAIRPLRFSCSGEMLYWSNYPYRLSHSLGWTLLLYPPYPKDRGMLWFYVEAARRPPPAMVLTR